MSSLMPALEAYLYGLHLAHASGIATKETSHYPALKALLDAAGATLRPPVLCVVNPAGLGSGIPDVGLYTRDQLQRGARDAAGPRQGLLPARGVVEAKGAGADVRAIAASEQVARYLQRYRLVLVTNYWHFQLVGLDEAGRPAPLEAYRLAETEAAFWAAAAEPRTLAAAHAGPFGDYLQRALLHAAPLATARDLASVLASYARIALARVEHSDAPALAPIRQGLEEMLGIDFKDEQGAHFFRSTLVQTLFYGIFSAWVLWQREHGTEAGRRFDWKAAGYSLQVPAIGFLFWQVAQPHHLRPLGLVEVLNWAGEALDRVDRAAFFAQFEAQHAVQYFYEPFLQEFDPELRRELGVWYTPPEIVDYMVARVDTALRQELGLAAGLADPRVFVLDPCCGTGTYLLAVIRSIAARLQEDGADALVAQDIKRAVLERVAGFELLPAPFVVAHMQIGLLLQRLGAPLADDGRERAGVYLTNALTGWHSPEGGAATQARMQFPELAEERDAAAKVKRESPILVILGNPPYNGFAGLAMGEERDLTAAYRTASGTRQPQGQGLNDLYVRFFRMAERRIAQEGGAGVVCYISNYSWLDGLSFTAMRERLLEAFDAIWIDNLNGDKYKTGKRTPDGGPDPSIFSTEWNHEGIQVGTAIALLVRRHEHRDAAGVSFRHLWGTGKRAELLADAAAAGAPRYETLVPSGPLGLPFLPLLQGAGYQDWPTLPELFPTAFPGVKTSRDDVVVDTDRDRLMARMRAYFDPAIGHEQMRRIAPGAMDSTARFQAEAVRDQLRKRGFLPEKVVPYYYRPFDVRWLYWEPGTKLLDEKRAEYFPQVFEGNVWLSAGQRNRKEAFYQPQPTPLLADHHLVESNVGMFPLYLRGKQQASLFDGDGAPPELSPNLSPAALDYLRGLDAAPPDLFYHALATLHSPAYRAENAGALRQDWPRLPLPADAEALAASAALGRALAALFDLRTAVPGVTAAPLRPELRIVGGIARLGGAALDPARDLELTAGWGFAGQGGVTMAGRGRAVPRPYGYAEREAQQAGAAALGLTAEGLRALLGGETCDIWLNEVAYWGNVPRRVWEYTIGGYQVLKKWLSYRERALLGRALTVEEARLVAGIVRRIAAILLLGPALDAAYWAAAAAPPPSGTADGADGAEMTQM